MIEASMENRKAIHICLPWCRSCDDTSMSANDLELVFGRDFDLRCDWNFADDHYFRFVVCHDRVVVDSFAFR